MINQEMSRYLIILVFAIVIALGLNSFNITGMVIGDGEDEDMTFAVGVVTDSSDNIITLGWKLGTGDDYNVFIDKSDSNGDKIWGRIYDSGFYDYASDIDIDSLGNILVAGKVEYDKSAAISDVFLLKYDSDGNMLWHKEHDYLSGEGAEELSIDSNDNIIVTGYGFDSSGNLNYVTMKFDSDGNTVWNRTYQYGSSSMARGIAVDLSDNIIVTGLSQSAIATIKYDSNGDVLWTKRYDVSTYGGGVQVDSSNNIIISGRTGSNTADSEAIVIKYDSSGNLLWSRTQDTNGYNYQPNIIVDSLDNVITIGDGNFNPSITSDYYIIKYNSAGDLICSDVFDSGAYDRGRAITIDSNDNFIVTGEITTGSDKTYRTIKYDPDCNIVWSKSVSSTTTTSTNETTTELTTSISTTVSDTTTTTPSTVASSPSGGSPPVSTTTVQPVTESIETISANMPYVIDIQEKQPSLSVKQIEITPNEDIEDINIQIKPEYEPINTLDLREGKTVYEYVSIEIAEEEEISEKVEEAYIYFTVSNEWIENVKPDSVKLNRFHDNEWQELETEFVEFTEDGAIFRSKTPGFSLFGISGELKETNLEGDSSISNIGPEEFLIIIIITIVILALIILAIYKFISMKSNKPRKKK